MGKALKGINLGGWLLTERWMTPALFKGVVGHGEVELVRQLGRTEATRRLEKHRSTFITEKDIAALSQQGFELVRVPVGYWLFDDTDTFVAGREYLTLLFKWARRHKIRVIIDLHGLYGSQNGKDHSGKEGPVLFYKSANQQASLKLIARVVRTYGHHPSLAAIQIINEPSRSLAGLRLIRYYRRAYQIVAEGTRQSVKVVVSDSFMPQWVSILLGLAGFGERLVMDIHLYQVFSRRDRQKDEVDYLRTVRQKWSKLLAACSRRVPIMVGEWSVATGRLSTSTAFKRQYLAAQERVFDGVAWAQCYWSYKAPGQGVWSYGNLDE